VRFFRRTAELEDRVEGLELLLAGLLLGDKPKPAKDRPRDRAMPPGACRPPAPLPNPRRSES
jgi:hypothetical protein